MDNRDITTRLIIGASVILLLAIIAVNKPHDMIPPPINVSKEDSLINVIDSLKSELQFTEDGWSKKELRYEDVLFEYELGISYLKDYHPKAYQDFHRIIGMKERYSFELERENKKRLQLEKYNYE